MCNKNMNNLNKIIYYAIYRTQRVEHMQNTYVCSVPLTPTVTPYTRVSTCIIDATNYTSLHYQLSPCFLRHAINFFYTFFFTNILINCIVIKYSSNEISLWYLNDLKKKDEQIFVKTLKQKGLPLLKDLTLNYFLTLAQHKFLL